jgi:hypothetical protein
MRLPHRPGMVKRVFQAAATLLASSVMLIEVN